MELGSLIFELQRASDEAVEECPSHVALLDRAIEVIQEVVDIRAAATFRGVGCSVSDPCPLRHLATPAG
jgi:hypothetical protein